MRSELDQAEEKLNVYRQQRDSVDLNLEAKAVLEQIVNVDNQLNELTFREADLPAVSKITQLIVRCWKNARRWSKTQTPESAGIGNAFHPTGSVAFKS